jgi:hypothetical protein
MASAIESRRTDLLGSVYERLANEEDARVCRDIPEEACHNVPRNFFTILAANALTKLGDELLSPKTVLAWLVGFIGAPAYLAALLVPIRESGSLIPQLGIAAFVRRMPIRKRVWVLGSVLQFLSVMGISACAISLRGVTAGWVVIGCLVVFSLARGMCSISYKDVLGKTIAKTRRGLLTGWAASISGGIAIGAGALLLAGGRIEQSPALYGWLTAGAGLLWLGGAVMFSQVIEEPGATSGGGNAGQVAIQQLNLLRIDRDFRNFVLTRALMLSTALTAPYYVLLAREQSGALKSLGLFVVAAGLAGLISGPIWGKLSDVSSRLVLVWAGIAASLTGLVTFALVQFGGTFGSLWWLIPLLYFALCVAHNGVRLGRKTYLVDMAGGTKRTDYVAISNTAIGVILLAAGLAGAAAGSVPAQVLILVFSVLSVLGSLLGLRLPEVQTG